jgi:hypothetical protein
VKITECPIDPTPTVCRLTACGERSITLCIGANNAGTNCLQDVTSCQTVGTLCPAQDPFCVSSLSRSRGSQRVADGKSQVQVATVSEDLTSSLPTFGTRLRKP